ncbi:MAG: DUF1565 domain-containing protein, partial [Gemmatimonadota bacterium]|nr:DUF1565 domain-containing protein [Gemmatimonadota bacterium]
MSRIKANRFAGSIFFLSPGTTYQVEVTVTDSGGVSGGMKIVQVTTRSDRFPIGSGREYYVDPSGDDSNKGTNSKPFRTIQKGADFARPGDIVWVMPGMYREEVMVTRSGKKDSYIAFIARGKGVVISGADPGYENLQKPGNWQLEQGDVYSTNPGYRTRYVAADGQRLYHYRTKGEFEEFICGEPGGWYHPDTTLQ